MSRLLCVVTLAALLPAFAQQGTVDFDKLLATADALLEEAKSAYEEARDKSSAPRFVEAGFKLEECRIKFVVIQEIGPAEKQKVAADRLRAVNQLGKLIHDGKVAVSGTPAEAPATPDSPAPAADKPAPAAPLVKPAGDVTKRLPVPDAAKQKDAEKLIRDLFKDQYAKKAPADRKALGRTLLEQAHKAGDDPGGLWVLCRDAQEIGTQICDPSIFMTAIDAAALAFDIDSLSLKIAALGNAGKAAKTPDDFAALAEAYPALIEDLTTADNFEAADKAASTALQYAKKSNNPTLAARATVQSKEIAEAKTLYQSFKSVLETLAKSPDDPNANQEMGKFLCFVKNNWDLGLRFMVKGSDAALKKLAEKELALPPQAEELSNLADAWFEMAEKEKSFLRKSRMMSHAATIYAAALPTATSLLKVRIEKRLGDLKTEENALPKSKAQTAGAVDLLKLVEVDKDAIGGSWTMEKDGLTSAATGVSRVQIPYVPPEEYDITCVVQKKTGGSWFHIGIVVGGLQTTVMMDGFDGSTIGIAMLDGQPGASNESSKKASKVFADNKQRTLLLQVRADGLTLLGDGKPLWSWKGDYKRVSLNPALVVPIKDALFLTSNASSMVVSKLLLVPVRGQGKVVPHKK